MKDANKNRLVPVVGLVAALVAVVAIVVVVTRKQTVDPRAFLAPYYEGYDTVGNAYLTKQGEDSFVVEYSNVFDVESDARALFDALFDAARYDAFEDLTNGDPVTLSFDLSDEEIRQLERTYGCQLVTDEQTFTVSGLTEPETVDPFENISVTYHGGEGYATAEAVNDNPEGILTELKFQIEPEEGLSNGDTITVSTLDTMSDDILLRNYGVILSAHSKEYTVSGLGTYLTSLADLSDENLETLKGMAEDTRQLMVDEFADTEEDDVVHKEILLGSDYVGILFADDKEDWEKYEPVNTIRLVYRNCIEQYTQNADDVTDEQVIYYACYEFDDVTLDADGNLLMDDLKSQLWGFVIGDYDGDYYIGFTSLEEVAQEFMDTREYLGYAVEMTLEDVDTTYELTMQEGTKANIDALTE